MSVGATTVLLPDRPTPAAIFDVLRAQQPTLFFGAPTLYAAMLADAGCTPENGSAAPAPAASRPARRCRSTSAPMEEALRRRHPRRHRLHRDAAHLPLQPAGRAALRHLRRAGARLRRAARRRARRGCRGRRGGRAAGARHRRRRRATGTSARRARRTFEGEWTRTGDKYIRDPDGMYRYCGRTDDMFKVSGLWVSPFEVESALITHPAVLEAAVVADGGQRRAAEAEGLRRAEGRRERATSLARGAEGAREGSRSACGNIRAGSSSSTSLPKTATGKIQRFKLREHDDADADCMTATSPSTAPRSNTA